MSTTGTERLLMIRFPARSESLQEVRQAVRDALSALGCGRDFVDSSVLAVDEATVNVIRHAYAGCEPGDIVLEIAESSSEIIFRLTDFAPPVDEGTCKSRDLDDVRPGGLGLFIIDQVMDRRTFVPRPQGAGNVLEMARKRVCVKSSS